MKLVRYRDMDPKWREAIIEKDKEEMMQTRQSLIERIGEEKANGIWYAKLDYINNWKRSEEQFMWCCEKCGCPEFLMETLKDEAGSCQTRKRLNKCSCGRYIEVQD